MSSGKPATAGKSTTGMAAAGKAATTTTASMLSHGWYGH
jgi:hypothetical protein